MKKWGKLAVRANLILFLAVIAGVIVFWNKIPEQIPSHYGLTGKIDAWSDKGILIMLVFMLAIMEGIGYMILYYIKSSMRSKFATDSEKETYPGIYVMLELLQFALTVCLAYVILCGALCKNTGVLFLPVMVVVCAAPIAGMIMIQRKSYSPDRIQRKEYRRREKTEKGHVYRSKVDWWIGLICVGSLLMPFMFIPDILKGNDDWGSFLFTFVLIWGLIFPLFVDLKYTCYSDYLKVRCTYWGTIRIPYACISGMKETKSALSSAAMSLDRLQIDYRMGGKNGLVYISPVRKKQFMDEINEHINKKSGGI